MTINLIYSSVLLVVVMLVVLAYVLGRKHGWIRSYGERQAWRWRRQDRRVLENLRSAQRPPDGSGLWQGPTGTISQLAAHRAAQHPKNTESE